VHIKSLHIIIIIIIIIIEIPPLSTEISHYMKHRSMVGNRTSHEKRENMTHRRLLLAVGVRKGWSSLFLPRTVNLYLLLALLMRLWAAYVVCGAYSIHVLVAAGQELRQDSLSRWRATWDANNVIKTSNAPDSRNAHQHKQSQKFHTGELSTGTA